MTPRSTFKVALPSRATYALDAILADAPMRLVIDGGSVIRTASVDPELHAEDLVGSVPPVSGERLVAAAVQVPALPRLRLVRAA